MDASSFFVPCQAREPLAPGLILAHAADGRHSYQRITHVFERTIFVMGVSTPEEARNAKRPKKLARAAVDNQIELGVLQLGRFRLPSEFSLPWPKGSEEDLEIERRKDHLAPLLSLFGIESNLGRASFTSNIITRAVELMMSDVSLRRLLLRYWYFGGLDQCLLPLRPGPEAGRGSPSAPEAAHEAKQAKEAQESEAPAPARRRPGAKPRLTGDGYPEISFIPGPLDFQDMNDALERLALSGATTWVDAHEAYMSVEFARRHPQLAKDFADDKILCPVSLRQFIRIIKETEQLSADTRQNVAGLSETRSHRALHSTGPGDVYEVDATGGQIYLVASSNPSRILGHPTIYVLIDRWSRFVVAVYVTLDSPSWQALRMLMRIAFTSREERFKLLGLPIDDKRWPIGVPPAQMAMDRGPEMISKPMLDAAVEGLYIEPIVLPPLTPDGKAIVERVIRTLKSKLKARGTKGVHEKNVLGPKAHAALTKARRTAVHSLAELYRTLVDIVDKYNHATHSGLKARAELRQAGVAPTPVAAFQWGLANLTGIQRPPLAEEDYLRLTLQRASGLLGERVLRYKRWRYFPDNDAARRIARRASGKPRAHEVALDRSLPTVIYSPADSLQEWPRWRIEAAGRAWYGKMTFEEEESLASEHALVHAHADHNSLRERVAQGMADQAVADQGAPGKSRRGASGTSAAKSATKSAAKSAANTAAKSAGSSAAKDDHQQRRRESAALNRALSGQAPPRPRPPASATSASAAPPAADSATSRARKLEQQEEAALLALGRPKPSKGA